MSSVTEYDNIDVERTPAALMIKGVTMNDDVIEGELIDDLSSAQASMSTECLLTDEQAHELDNLFRETVDSLAEQWVFMQTIVTRVREVNLYKRLGFPSHSAYVANVFEGRVQIEDRADRLAKVTFLHDNDFSTRAIAKLTGVSQTTVVEDIERSKVGGSTERNRSVAESDNGSDAAPSPQFSDTEPKRTGLDGRKRRAVKPPPAEPAELPTEALPKKAYQSFQALIRGVQELTWVLDDKRYRKYKPRFQEEFGPVLRDLRTLMAKLYDEEEGTE